jgi:hypothetical protein
MSEPNIVRYFNSSPEVIRVAVMMYIRHVWTVSILQVKSDGLSDFFREVLSCIRSVE